MEWEIEGKQVLLYGIVYEENGGGHVKLDETVWFFECDMIDGYRSYCGEPSRVDNPSIGPFFSNPLEIVTVRPTDDGDDLDGFTLVDDSGHVWLSVGTDNSDHYYPFCVFYWQPKQPT